MLLIFLTSIPVNHFDLHFVRFDAGGIVWAEKCSDTAIDSWNSQRDINLMIAVEIFPSTDHVALHRQFQFLKLRCSPRTPYNVSLQHFSCFSDFEALIIVSTTAADKLFMIQFYDMSIILFIPSVAASV